MKSKDELASDFSRIIKQELIDAENKLIKIKGERRKVAKGKQIITPKA